MEIPKLLALAAIALGYMLSDQATRCALSATLGDMQSDDPLVKASGPKLRAGGAGQRVAI